MRQRQRRWMYCSCGPQAAIPLILALWACFEPVQAQPRTEHQRVEIAAGDLRDALDSLAATSGMTLLYAPGLVTGRTTRGAFGVLTPVEALTQLLRGTGLLARSAGSKAFTLSPESAVGAASAVGSSVARQEKARLEAPTEPRTIELGEVSVTGTRIRGGSAPSPVLVLAGDRWQGFGNLGELIRAVPQNFSGGQNPSVPSLGYSGAGIQNQNVTGGSALNLRGLGPDATLTLLNGRRMAYGGMTQAVEIDAIPTAAVDRIEILLDGASAIYGSDAVAGVGNVILKRDFDGMVVGALFGAAVEGGLATRKYSMTTGATWTDGGMIAAYERTQTDPIFARQREYASEMKGPTTLYPGSNLESGLISVHHPVGKHGEATLDVLHFTREQDYMVASPSGRTNQVDTTTATALVAPTLSFFSPGGWEIKLAATQARSDHIQYQRRTSRGAAHAPLSVQDCLCNTGHVYEVSAEGPLLSVSAREMRVAIGAGYRRSEFRHVDELARVPITLGRDSSKFAYMEASLPAGTGMEDPGRDLGMSFAAALRAEDSASFKRVLTPKLSVTYGIGAAATLKASWGRSFKAPTLLQRHLPPYVMLATPDYFGGEGYVDGATALATAGGNRELGPERARSWTASVLLRPQALPDMELGVTWYGIDYTDRVVQPITSFAEALSNPMYAQFVDSSPSSEMLAARISDSSMFYNFSGVEYDPARVAALIRMQYANVARQKVRGIDLSGSHTVNLRSIPVSLSGSAVWLESTQHTTDNHPPLDLAGTSNNPPRFGARVGATWGSGPWVASIFVNHKSGVKSLSQDAGKQSFTTVDAMVRIASVDTESASPRLEFAIAVHNVLDRDPPYARSWLTGYAPQYDATNYSPVGRFLSMSLAARW